MNAQSELEISKCLLISVLPVLMLNLPLGTRPPPPTEPARTSQCGGDTSGLSLAEASLKTNTFGCHSRKII